MVLRVQPAHTRVQGVPGVRRAHRGDRADAAGRRTSGLPARHRPDKVNPGQGLRGGHRTGRAPGGTHRHPQQGAGPGPHGRGHRRRRRRRLPALRHGLRMEVRVQDAGGLPHRQGLLQGVRRLRPRGGAVRQGEQEPDGPRRRRRRPRHQARGRDPHRHRRPRGRRHRDGEDDRPRDGRRRQGRRREDQMVQARGVQGPADPPHLGRRSRGQPRRDREEGHRGCRVHQEHDREEPEARHRVILRREGQPRLAPPDHRRRPQPPRPIRGHRTGVRRDRGARPRRVQEAQPQADRGEGAHRRLLRKPGLLRAAGQGLQVVLQDQQARPHRRRHHEELPGRGAVVHRPEEVRVRGQERQAQGLDQPLDPRADRGVPHPELVRHARVAVHLLQEGALQRVVHPRPGQDRMLPLPRVGPGGVRGHRRCRN